MNLIFILEKGKKSDGAKSGEYGGWGTAPSVYKKKDQRGLNVGLDLSSFFLAEVKKGSYITTIAV
jgi:hypothetical protein